MSRKRKDDLIIAVTETRTWYYPIRAVDGTNGDVARATVEAKEKHFALRRRKQLAAPNYRRTLAKYAWGSSR